MCRLPLYQQAQHADLSDSAIQSGNAGLYFTRFYDQYTDAQLQGQLGAKNEEGKKKFLIKFANVIGQHEQLRQHAFRQTALMDTIGGSTRLYSLDGHFVTGMGNAHPVENGFQWHYTLGVPYLAGSQVKGMVRSMIERYLDENKCNKPELLLKWFGSTDKDPQKAGQAQRGELIFFDALPYKKPILTVDVMTPHMGDWYAQGSSIKNLQDSSKIPADWHAPVPIPFLTVKSAAFLFSIGKRFVKDGDKYKISDINLDEVWKVLEQALAYLGAGGKTNTGFGYMSPYAPETELYQKLSAEAKAGQWMAETNPIEDDYARQRDHYLNYLRRYWLGTIETNPDEVHNEVQCFKFLIKVAEFYYAEEIDILRGKKEGKVKKNKKDFLQPLLEWEKSIS